MSLAISQNALSTTAEKIVNAFNGPRRVTIKNLDGSIVVYIGTTDAVTSSNGFRLIAGELIVIENECGELYAIAASSTPSIALIEQRQ